MVSVGALAAAEEQLGHLVFLAPSSCIALAADFDRLGVEVDDEIAGIDDRLGMTLGAAHDGVDARDQLVLVERLGHVVVGAEAETLDLVLDAREAGKDHDWRLDLRRPAGSGRNSSKARHVGQVQVQQYDVVVIELAEVDAFFTQVGGVDVEALGFQHQLNRLSRGAVVFNE